jgi:hypothetical protein
VIVPLLIQMKVGSNNYERVAFAAGITGLLVFVVGFGVSFFLPEPPAEKH